MAMEKQKRLVRLLLKKTERGELDWREAVSANTFQVALTDKVLRIRTTPSRVTDEDVDFHIELVNSEGKIIDTFTDVELHQSEEDRDTRWYVQLRDLFDMARRTALGSEQILNELLSELGEDEIPF
jgi:hypothetical protein